MSLISRTSSIFFFAAIASALGGCSSQGDTNYRGEPLAIVSGTVATGTDPAPSQVSAGIAWAQPQLLTGVSGSQTVSDVGYLGETTPVSGAFPAGFTLDVFSPPPANSAIKCVNSDANFYAGFLVALSGAPASGSAIDPATVVGAANDYLLVYLDTDEPAGWSCIDNMGFTLQTTKGYHLMQAVPNSFGPHAFGTEYPAYDEAPQGLSTSITVTLGAVLPFTPHK